jgi:hypothetical protein
MQITISYGMQSVTVDRPEGTTVGALMADPNIKAVVGFTENSVPLIGGATVDSGYVVQDGDEVALQARAATKA